jgi:hypothetical protein
LYFFCKFIICSNEENVKKDVVKKDVVAFFLNFIVYLIYMDYEKITPIRTARIALEPTGFGRPYKKLFNQTDVSGYEVWLLESYNNFQNPFAKASEALYDKMGPWAEIFRDVIVESFGMDDKENLKVRYISHYETEFEKEHDVWFPKIGWYVPTKDGIFVPGTLVPFRTVETKEEAIKEWEKAGLNAKYVSYFYRMDSYKDSKFVSRYFFPHLFVSGRFFIRMDKNPSDSGIFYIGSRKRSKKTL